MIWLWIYLAGVALILATVVRLRQIRLAEDGSRDESDDPWWIPLAVLGIAFAWPLVLGLIILYPLMPDSW